MGLVKNVIENDGLFRGPITLAHDIKGLPCPRKGSKRSKKSHSHVCKQVQRFIRDAWLQGRMRAYKDLELTFEGEGR